MRMSSFHQSHITCAPGCRGDEERLRDGPSSSSSSSAAEGKQRQREVSVVIDRPPGCPLTYAGSQAVEGMLAGLEGDFVVSMCCSSL
jgi:hypothetical protein